MADEGRFGAQVFFLHDAGRGDGERDQVEGEDHGKEGAKDGELGGCRHGQEGHPVSHCMSLTGPTMPSQPDCSQNLVFYGVAFAVTGSEPHTYAHMYTKT